MIYYDQPRNFTQLNSDIGFRGTWSGKPESIGSLGPESTFERNFESKNFRSPSITSLNLSYFDNKSVLDISDTSSILEKQSRSDEKRPVKNQDNDIQRQKNHLELSGQIFNNNFSLRGIYFNSCNLA